MAGSARRQGGFRAPLHDQDARSNWNSCRRPGRNLARRWGSYLVPVLTRSAVRACARRRARVRSARLAQNDLSCGAVHDVEQLVTSAANGDSRAWDTLVDRFAGLIWSVARAQGLAAADASEVSQTTWLRLAEHIGTIKDPARIPAWLATTARREAIRVSRLGARHILVDPWEHLDVSNGDEDVDAEVMGQERDLAIQRAMALLPDRCRELLYALVAQDPPVPYATISERHGMPVGSIGPTRARCLEHLRELLEVVEAESKTRSPVAEGLPR